MSEPVSGYPEIFTIGHSTIELAGLIGILTSNRITLLLDVRTVPRSRRNPQFNRETLPTELEQAGIRYLHEPALGGLRRPAKDSGNTGWRNDSFRGFADYMQGAEFEKAIGRLVDLARSGRVALMCAEAVPWRCHRSLIADALLVRGEHVVHLLGKGTRLEHKLTPFAKVSGSRVTYPAESGP